jgi:hypothetical protein
LPEIACSDAHTLGEFGSAYSEVPDVDPSKPEKLLTALDEAEHVTARSPVWVSAFSTMARALDIVGL